MILTKITVERLLRYFKKSAIKHHRKFPENQEEVTFRIYNQDLITKLASVKKFTFVFIECNYKFESQKPENEKFSFRAEAYLYADVFSFGRDRSDEMQRFNAFWQGFNVPGIKIKIYPEIVSGLRAGFYKIYWKKKAGGGSSLAAIGTLNSGTKWVAPVNWVSGGNSITFNADVWEQIKAVKPLKFRS